MTDLVIVALVGLLTLGVMFLRATFEYDRAIRRLQEEQAAERRLFLEHIAAQRKEIADERRSLMDRIQHPDRIQVIPSADYRPPKPPRDEAELAHVGQMVPEFVQVGTPGTGPGEGPPEVV
jgi:hypothetical protein